MHPSFVVELHVREALRATRELVHHDRDPVDRAAALEVLLQLLGGGAVIHISHIDGPLVGLVVVSFFPRLGGGLGAGVDK